MNKIHIFFKFLLFFLFMGIEAVHGQLDNRIFEKDSIPHPIKIGSIQFSNQFLIFIKNNEYFNPTADGYTLTGYYINPNFSYYLHQNIKINIGVFAGKNFGEKGFSSIEPTFQVEVRNKSWKYLFGNLEGNLKHRLIEPLMGFERILSSPLEHGFQAKYQKKEHYFDTWLDWQASTIAGKSNQEKIWFGYSYYSPTLIKHPKTQVQLIAQGSIFHQGGQDLAVSLPVRTFINLNQGMKISYSFANRKMITIENHWVHFTESPKNGNGYYLNAFRKSDNYQWGLSYWYGNQFISPFGNPLFQSESVKLNQINYQEKIRNIIIFRFSRDWHLHENLTLTFRAEPYFDLRNKIFEHSEGLYLHCQF